MYVRTITYVRKKLIIVSSRKMKNSNKNVIKKFAIYKNSVPEREK